MTIHIRPMRAGDKDDVFAVEEVSGMRPWLARVFRIILSKRHTTVLVAEVRGEVVAYIAFQTRAKHVDLITLAVHPAFRRHGIGSALVLRLIEDAGQRRRIVFFVRESYLQAHLFLRSVGFRAAHVFPEYFDDGAEDAYVFHHEVPAAVPRFAAT